MSSGKELQEMEVGTKQSKTAVNANAAPGEPMHKGPEGAVTPGNSVADIEDLGGPTPDNYSPTNDSAKLKPAAGTLKQVRDVVNKGAKAAEPMGKLTTGAIKSGDEVELEADQEVVSEEPATEENVVAEEEVSTEEVVAEEETTEEEVVAEAPEYTEIDIEQDVNALIEGEELSEDFKNKAKTILETAVKGQVNQIKETLVADYDKRLLEEVEEIKTALNERIDSYLEYVADEWFNENQLAVQGGLKEELTESFMTGLKGLFEEHYVELPEEKYDVLQNMVDKLDEMETKLNEQVEKNVILNKRLAESSSDVILADVSEGLAATQKEKLASLAESVEFESENAYREKLVTLRESYFPTAKAPAAKTESLSEGVDNSGEDISGSMAGYLKTLKGLAS